MPTTWLIETLKSVVDCADPKTKICTLKDLTNKYLAEITKKVKSAGKTPQATMRACLQELRDEGFVKFLGEKDRKKQGTYLLQPINIDIDKLQKNSKQSKGERLIAQILTDMGIDFTQEKKFADLKHKTYLRFDFYFEIQGRGFLIEFDGKQHREPVEFFGGEKAFVETKIRDEIKNEYARRHNMPLIRIDNPDISVIKRMIK